MLEKDLQAKVLKWIKAQPEYRSGSMWVHKMSELYSSGIPDLMGVVGGIPFAIELKVGKNVPTPLQEKTLEAMGKAGYMTAICWEENEVIEFMEGVLALGHLQVRKEMFVKNAGYLKRKSRESVQAKRRDGGDKQTEEGTASDS